MAESKMELIARAIGVEMGEDFYLVNEGGLKEHRCRLTETGIERMTAGEWGVVGGLLEKVLLGKYTTESVVWKPKVGERYWTYCRKDWATCNRTNNGTFETALKIANGVAFRTKVEAETARETAYELITGKKWSEKAR